MRIALLVGCGVGPESAVHWGYNQGTVHIPVAKWYD